MTMCLIQSGANTTYSWIGIQRGLDLGMPNNATIALSMATADATELFLLTRNVFNVDSASGGHSMVYRYDMGGESFDGPHWRATDHGLNQKTDGLDINGDID